LNEEIDAKECISSFRLGLGRFPEKEIASIEENDLFPLTPYLMDQGCLLGHTAKRTPESPTGLNLTHYIICIDDGELNFGYCLDQKTTKKI